MLYVHANCLAQMTPNVNGVYIEADFTACNSSAVMMPASFNAVSIAGPRFLIVEIAAMSLA